MKTLRTPESRFAGLADYPFQPHYTVVKTTDDSDLRIHHIDEGSAESSIVLLMHGQPTWSYLYRKMIPLLVDAGLRVIAPDLPGYGKSDKPAALEDYSYQNQVDWMNAWLRQNDFSDVTLFGQDWGGLIGLRMVADNPDRFARIVIGNSGLPNPAMTGPVSDEDIEAVKDFRANAKTPTMMEMAKELRNIPKNRAKAFAYWQKFTWETVDLPIGRMMEMMLLQSQHSKFALGLHVLLSKIGLSILSPIRTELAKAYGAPFPDPSYKMGPRAMPSQVPTLPDDPSIEAQTAAWKFFSQFEKPFLCTFTDDDPVTRGMDKVFQENIPGTKGQAHATLTGGGHFLQEKCSQQLSSLIVEFVRST